MSLGNRNGDFEARRQKLLDVLTSPGMANGSYNVEHRADEAHYSNRSRWQHYTACMTRGIKLDEVNDYFANSDEIEAAEWHTLCYIRTYFQFKDKVLSKAAAQRLLDVIKEYKEKAMDDPKRKIPERQIEATLR